MAQTQTRRSKALAACAALPLLFASASAQYNPSAPCTAPPLDVIVNLAPGANETLVRGVIGTEGTTVTWQTVDGGVTVTPNPAFKTDENFWFFKFDTAECYDIRNYNTAEFEFNAPVGSTFGWTMTIHQAVCEQAGAFGCYNASYYCPRGPDTDYKFLADYVPGGQANGSWQKVSMPLYDVRINVADNATDFKHIKDWTFVNHNPATAVYRYRNFRLKCRPDYPSIQNLPTTITKTNPDPNGFKWDRTGVDFSGTNVGTSVATQGASPTSGAAAATGTAAAPSTSTGTAGSSSGTAGSSSPSAGKSGAAAGPSSARTWFVGAFVAVAMVFAML